MASQAFMLSSNFSSSGSPSGLQGSIQVARSDYKVRCKYVTPNNRGGGISKLSSWMGHDRSRSRHRGRGQETEKKTTARGLELELDGHERVATQKQLLTLGEYAEDVIQTHHLIPLINWHPHHHNHEDTKQVDRVGGDEEEIRKRVRGIRQMLGKMKDGEITVSAYDTAWVALVEDGGERPMFPECVEWIRANQLGDGSWGDPILFLAHDRILNTLACVVALSSWNLHPNSSRLGMEFIRRNLGKLREEKEEHMPIGFEVAFPSLIQMAQTLGIHLFDHSGVLQDIYSKRNLKLSRIPPEMVHNKATTLLHSLEGMSGLDWEKLLKLQSKDGSFLFSPSSTAYALMQTKDLNCFSYLQNILHNFNGGVPNVYPVDLFEHLWVVDRLERLGISRFFHSEINACLDYVYKYWSDKGICWARNSEVQDIDDTAMGFRLLRLHGYHVSAGVFEKFRKEGEFMCFAGQSSQAVTGMFNLYRASQLQYPGETVLQEARSFSSNYLTQKKASNQLLDKWIIQKDLPGEVHSCLP